MARRRRFIASPLRTTALAVVVLCAVLFILPRAWTAPLRGLAQILLPFQHATSSAADSLTTPAPSGLSAVECADLENAKAAAQRREAALALRVRQLEDEVKTLSATRLWDVAGARLGAKGRLIPARVIAEDLLPWRSSRVIDAGHSKGASNGDPVTTRDFAVDRGEREGVRSGLAIVTGETLMGFIDLANSQSARVKLLSDPQSAMKVRVGRVIDQTFAGPDRYFWLVGRGPGRMEIRDAERKELEAGLIQVGDMVLSDPQDELLPAAMLIGRVDRIDENPDNPLFVTVGVAGAVPERSLRRVYIYDPAGDAAE